MKSLKRIFAILSVVTIMFANVGVFAEPEEGTSEKYGSGTSKIIGAANQDEGETKKKTSNGDNKTAKKATEETSEKSEKKAEKATETKTEKSENKSDGKTTTQKSEEKTEKKSETKTVATIKPEEKKETEKKESSKTEEKESEKEETKKDAEEKDAEEKDAEEKDAEEKEKKEDPTMTVNKGKNAEQINANKYLTKSGALGMFLLTVLVSAIVSFLISYRFYKMKKSDNYLSSEIRALKRDIDSKMSSLVNGVSEYEVKTTNANPDYSEGNKGLEINEELTPEEETVDIYSKWERQINTNESKTTYGMYDSEDDIEEYSPRMERNRRERNQRNDRLSKTRKNSKLGNSKGRGTYPDRFSRD